LILSRRVFGFEDQVSNRLETEILNREVKSYMELMGEKVRTISIGTQIPVADKNKFI
jgi:hypothetical protein